MVSSSRMMLCVFVLATMVIVQGMPYKFPSSSPWYTDISTASVDSNSANVIAFLNSTGGWSGSKNNFQSDMSLNIQYADASTPRYKFVKAAGYYSPDCDSLATFPVSANGQIEGRSPYNAVCDGDCHYSIVDTVNKKLYESYITYVDTAAKSVSGVCGVVWDLCQLYPANLRGEQCTSVDAAGFPVAPLLPTADELASGVIDHAFRFTMPNNVMRKGYYVHPASHAGGPSSTNANAIIYGSRLRLKSSFALTKLTNQPVSNATKVVVNALKKYGMFLADGGNIPLCFADDAFTTAKYANIGFDSHSLFGIKVTDFEVVAHTAPVPLTYNCVRNTFNTTSC